MTVKPSSKRKKRMNYFFNFMLLLIILILIVPSWRLSFQSWYQQLFLPEVEFELSSPISVPESQQNWELFSTADEMLNFADFKGKPIVLNCWASWCSSCRAEFPGFNGLYQKLGDEITFLAVSTESLDVIKNTGLAEEYEFLYSAQYYPEFLSVEAFPTLFIIDREMRVVYRSVGAADLNTDKNISFLRGLLAN
ncbi:MAG: TlpA disulfide reductase family protein [Crocinitomicaceae bacterium]